MSPLPLSNIFTQTPQVIYHRKRKNQGCGGQASKSSLGFGEDVPASLHYAVARKKTFGFE